MTTTPNFIVRRICQYAFQILIAIFGKIFLYSFTRRKLGNVNSAVIHNKGYLIIANHRGALDPFIIGSALPFRALLKLQPISFMTHNVFYESPLLPFIWLSGSYPARNPKNKHKIFGVNGSVALLQNGFSVFIFPEGTRVPAGQRGVAKPGVIRIHKAAPDVPFILAHIEYHKGLKAWLTFNLRTVHYDLIENPKFDDPEKVMDAVFAL